MTANIILNQALFCALLSLANDKTFAMLPFSDDYMELVKKKVDLKTDFPVYVQAAMLERIEQNLKFYELNKWTIDARAGLQLFLTRLNFKLALKNSRMKLFDHSNLQPISSKRLKAIVNRTDELGYFLRYRVLARIPRRNVTRQVSALYMFTELPWFRFVPSVAAEDTEKEMNMLNKTLTIKKRLGQYRPWPSTDYAQDLVLQTNVSQVAHNVTLECMECLTKNPLNEKAINETAPNVLIKPTRCAFPRSFETQCRTFIYHGQPLVEHAYGHVNFYRIALLTAARFARNCYFLSVTQDRRILNFLCYIALIEIDKFPSLTPDATYYTSADPLTAMDLANICLLNGYKRFMIKSAMESCALDKASKSPLAWNEIGCLGAKGNAVVNVSEPPPFWTISRQNIGENRFCNRRMTVSCLAYFSTVLRGIVDIGEVLNASGTTPKGGWGKTTTTTTEWLPLK